MTRPARSALVLAACAALWPACGPIPGSGTPFTATSAGPASTLAPNASLASLSGIWVGHRPAEGMVFSIPGCGACAGAPPFNAADVALNVSDSSHALSGSAILTVREGGPIGLVIPASVTGSVGPGGRVTMQWNASLDEGGQEPTSVLFALEGAVSANRMAGTVIVTGGGVPAGTADGTWSVALQ
jgi:hypothetical protein